MKRTREPEEEQKEEDQKHEGEKLMNKTRVEKFRGGDVLYKIR